MALMQKQQEESTCFFRCKTDAGSDETSADVHDVTAAPQLLSGEETTILATRDISVRTSAKMQLFATQTAKKYVTKLTADHHKAMIIPRVCEGLLIVTSAKNRQSERKLSMFFARLNGGFCIEKHDAKGGENSPQNCI
jgi:hypothetical protein